MFMALGALAGGILGSMGTAATAATVLSGAVTGFGVGSQLDAGRRQAAAGREAAEQSNEAQQRQYEYNVDLWNMEKQQILANRAQSVEVIEARARNEGQVAAYTDLMNAQRYNRDLQIKEREEQSLGAQYAKSEDIYHRQLSLNELSYKTATENEYAALQDIEAEGRYNQNERYLTFLKNEGQIRARGVEGRSTDKARQVEYLTLGQNMTAINASLAGGVAAARAMIQEISTDRSAADLAADAQRMLEPEELLDPIMPFATPKAEYVLPRAVGEFDFGPAPVLGVYTSPSAAASKAWGNTIAGIAGQLDADAIGQWGAHQYQKMKS
tara:strand:+ start:6293 stop:7270 length:978 start_codon:yes stop_codon:yes gene_type:complete